MKVKANTQFSTAARILANFETAEKSGLVQVDTETRTVKLFRAIWPPDKKSRKNWINNAWLYMAWKVGEALDQETETVTIEDVETGQRLGSYDAKGKAVLKENLER